MKDLQLTPHFKFSEFEKSSATTAHASDNHIPSTLIPNLTILCQEVLEPLRAFAGRPIIISSDQLIMERSTPTSSHY